jgi:hypothetical protein
MAELNDEADDRDRVPGTTASVLLLVGIVVGGALVGLAIAYGTAGGTPVAVFVGFMGLPVAFGLAMSAWRAMLGAWLAGNVGRALWRSRGDQALLRDELGRSVSTARRRGLDGLPGTWVFVPATSGVGLVAGAIMAVAAERNGLLAGLLVLIASIGMGIVMRRLARSGWLRASE